MPTDPRKPDTGQFGLPPLLQSYINKGNQVQRDATTVARTLPVAPLSKDKQVFQQRKKIAQGHNAGKSNLIRATLPLPKNAAGVVMKKVYKQNAFDRNSLSQDEKAVMYKVIQNAYHRTGKFNGGTEYSDYRGVVPEDEYKQIQKVVSGNMNPVLGTLLGATSTGFNMATTLGRVSYALNPETNEAVLTDGYDFTNSYTQGKDGKLKKGYMAGRTDPYSVIRKDLAEDDQNQTPEDKKRYLAAMRLFPSDTLSTWRRITK